MIRIICVGKIKEKYLSELINDYKMRISRYHKIEIIELKDSNIIFEEKELLKYIKCTDYNIALDIKGSKCDSLSLAKKIDSIFNNFGVINFIIGGSDGITDSVRERCNELISFSDLTFPHGLFRGILLEQIYRCFKINNNETYHK